VSNRLIVESKNDQYFFQAIIDYLNLQIEVDSISIEISEQDYKLLDGSDLKKLKNILKDLKAEAQKSDIQKVGIILDIDHHAVPDRLALINQCLQDIFSPDIQLTNIKEFIPILVDDNNIEFASYFTNIDGKGELETVLKTIKSQDSVYADCLESWKTCLQNHGKEISEKDFNKFWISNYLRFDTCSNTDKKQAGKYCSMSGFKYVMENKTDIWNFEHSSLLELKDFLKLFTNSKVEYKS